jgi:hypothetical protein
MDILNWIYLVKNKFTRTTVENPATDLLVLGADVSYAKRGDKYQNYAMPVADLVPLVYSTGDVEQLTTITTSVTLNTYSGVITTYYDATNVIPAGDEVSFRVFNSNVTGSSIVHVTLFNAGSAGGPLLNAIVGRVSSLGYFDVTLQNAGANDSTASVKVFFSIVNVTV